MRLVLLVISCIGLTALVWYDYTQDSDKEPAPNPTASSKSSSRLPATTKKISSGTDEISNTAVLNPYSALKLENMKDTVNRPLFSSTRKPAVQIVKAKIVPKITRAPEKATPEFLLMGVIRDGEKSVALLREDKTGKYYRVVKGDIVGNIRVADVFLKAIRLEMEDGSSQTLELKFTTP